MAFSLAYEQGASQLHVALGPANCITGHSLN